MQKYSDLTYFFFVLHFVMWQTQTSMYFIWILHNNQQNDV